MSSRTLVGSVEELRNKQRVVVDHEGTEVAVIRVSDGFVAFRNSCPHYGAPLASGVVGGTLMPGERALEFEYAKPNQILTCPWHHWEFDLSTARCLTDTKIRIRLYEVIVEGNDVFVVQRSRR